MLRNIFSDPGYYLFEAFRITCLKLKVVYWMSIFMMVGAIVLPGLILWGLAAPFYLAEVEALSNGHLYSLVLSILAIPGIKIMWKEGYEGFFRADNMQRRLERERENT